MDIHFTVGTSAKEMRPLAEKNAPRGSTYLEV
jgi:hypothetical protein